MKEKKFNKLKLGLYRVFWKEGGTTVAAIGMDYTGKRWLANTNWTGESDKDGSVSVAYTDRHKQIKKVVLITAN